MTQLSRVLTSLFVISGCLGMAHAAHAVNRYVSTNGDDWSVYFRGQPIGINACNLATAPCRTVGWAIQVANQGDEIRVAGGEYAGVDLRVSPYCSGGSSGISLCTSQDVRIEGGWSNSFSRRNGGDTIFTSATYLYANSNRSITIVFDDVVFRVDSTAPSYLNSSISIDPSVGGNIDVEFYRCELDSPINGAKEDLLHVHPANGGTARVTIRSSDVFNEIYVGANDSDVTLDFRYSRFHFTTVWNSINVDAEGESTINVNMRSNEIDSGIGVYGYDPATDLVVDFKYNTVTGDDASFQAYDGVLRGEIKGNEMRGGGFRVRADSLNWRNKITLRANDINGSEALRIFGTSFAGVEIEGDGSFAATTDSNFIYGHTFGILVRSGASLTSKYDTITANRHGIRTETSHWSGAVSGIVWGNDEIDLEFGPQAGSFWAAYTNISSIGRPLAFSVGNTDIPPQFVSPGASDYHLQDDSPLIDRAYCLGGGTGDDIDFEPRKYGAGCDMGADEVQPPIQLM